MKVVILAGGLGTRISEESHLRPKPMIEIGGKPIIWHIMKTFYAQGFDDFIICGGYKCSMIKEYFLNYKILNSDVRFNMLEDKVEIINDHSEEWKVTVVDTGPNTLTGGRLKRIANYLDDNEDFFFTYGDGVSDISLNSLLERHKNENCLATVTAVIPPGRFGYIEVLENKVSQFAEKQDNNRSYVNGGFFVLNKKCLDYIDGDKTSWESSPLERLAIEGQLAVYKHGGFWQAMDTMRDKKILEDLWQDGLPPWKNWS